MDTVIRKIRIIEQGLHELIYINYLAYNKALLNIRKLNVTVSDAY